MKRTEQSEKIRAFIEKWDGHISEDSSFADDCLKLGFKMDSGSSFKDAFPDENLTSAEVLSSLADRITDTHFLGTAIFSFWRYRTHWCDVPGGGLNEEAHQWFKIAFARLRALVETGSSPQRKFPHKMTAASLVNWLAENGNPQDAQGKCRFFRAEKGGYGEGDRFCGVSNPECRVLVREYRKLQLEEVGKLLYEAWHEARLCGLLILVEQYKHGQWAERKPIVDLYIKASTDRRINNWDLVDLSAPGIVGLHEMLYHTGIIRRFAASRDMWKNRIAIVSTLPLIKRKDFELTFELVKQYLTHPHDLMHKACGWMLREVGKQDRDSLSSFLNEFKDAMPRTMLRYAIEHYPEAQRKEFMRRQNPGRRNGEETAWHL